MRYRFMTILPIMILCVALCCGPIYADMGPKPSVVVRFHGIDPEIRYYVTLMAKEESTGPYSSVSYLSGLAIEKPSEDGNIWQKFVDYQDTDGYHFLQYFADCTGSDEFRWGYYPPEYFKILVYFPDSDQFVACPEILHQYAFASYFDAVYSVDGLTAETSGYEGANNGAMTSNGTITAKATYSRRWQALGFLTRLILTIALEVLLAPLFGYVAKKQLMVITVVNLMTQVLLNAVLLWRGFQPNFVIHVLEYGLLELGIILVEALAYMLFLQRFSAPNAPKPHPAAYAAAANVVSFATGYFISRLLPQIFS